MDMGLVLLNPVTFCPKEEVFFLLNALTVQIMNAKQYKINVVYWWRQNKLIYYSLSQYESPHHKNVEHSRYKELS